MSRTFVGFMAELEAEARREGPAAVAELAAFDGAYRLAADVLVLRKARGPTRRQVAARSGVRQAEIGRIEGGRANPSLTTIATLARALGAERVLRSSESRRTKRVRQAWP